MNWNPDFATYSGGMPSTNEPMACFFFSGRRRYQSSNAISSGGRREEPSFFSSMPVRIHRKEYP